MFVVVKHVIQRQVAAKEVRIIMMITFTCSLTWLCDEYEREKLGREEVPDNDALALRRLRVRTRLT